MRSGYLKLILVHLLFLNSCDNSVDSDLLFDGGDGAVDSGNQSEDGGLADASPFEFFNVLPLGDSITQGEGEHKSYRYSLWKMLIDANYEFDFVGSLETNHDGVDCWPDYLGMEFDRHHEGHWGWRADEILSELPYWLGLYDADVVLIHLGSNDVFDEQSAESTTDEIESIIDLLRDDRKDVAVLLAKIIPTYSDSANERIEALNNRLDELGSLMDSLESPVSVVDHNTWFDADEDTYDGVHPNDEGERKMASKWFEAIEDVLGTR